MTVSPQQRPQKHFSDPREIAKWASRYAKSRTIPFLVQWVFIVLIGAIIAGIVYFTFMAYRTENFRWILLCAAGIVGMVIALTWFAVPKWGGERIFRISQWVYGEEGYAEYRGGSMDEDISAPWWIYLLGAGLVLWHLLGTVLVAHRSLPLEYMQPFSALYMVPFFLMMSLSQRLGFWALIWPALYGLHAVLILLHVPIRFTEVHLEVLNMIVPIFGYGLIAILVGHGYSRYALYRLKSIVRKGLETDHEDHEETAR
jgi:MFS family permease